jgi:hypothetical protein
MPGDRAEDRDIDHGYMRDFVVRLRFAEQDAAREFLVRSTTVRGALSRAIDAQTETIGDEEARLAGAEIAEA